MIFLKLFLTFLEIGTVSFGGGYGMLSLIRETTIANGWLTEAQLMNFVAVSESTPGPIAINMATFVGSSQGGIFGAFCATVGVVLPAFVIMLIIAALLRSFMKYPVVNGIMQGVRPCVVGLILATALTLFMSNLLGFSAQTRHFNVSLKGVGIFAFIALFAFIFPRLTKKKASPIMLIVISAVLGIILF